MSEALRTPSQLPEEALALIREGAPKPKVANLTIAQPAASEPNVVLPEGGAGEGATTVEPEEKGPVTAEEKPATRAVRRRPEREKPDTGAADETQVPLVSMSFRIPIPLSEALVKASADRRIKRRRPHSQQAIVTEAVTAWLEKNGYLNAEPIPGG